MLAYLYGHLLLFRFAIGHLPLLFSLPGWLTDPAELERRLATLRDGTVQSLTLNFPSDQADAYNIALKQLGSKMQALHPHQMTASTRVFLLNLVRFSTVVAAWHGNIGLTLGVAITQFLIAPYSLFVSITAAKVLSVGEVMVRVEILLPTFPIFDQSFDCVTVLVAQSLAEQNITSK